MCGTHSTGLRERLLWESDLTLDKCLQVCRAMEISREHIKTIEGQTVEEVQALQQRIKTNKFTEISCTFCGRTHKRQKAKCPAFGKSCRKCGKENHFAVTCRSKVSYNKKGKKSPCCSGARLRLMWGYNDCHSSYKGDGDCESS